MAGQRLISQHYTASLETASIALTGADCIYRPGLVSPTPLHWNLQNRSKFAHPAALGIVALSPSQSEYSFNLAFLNNNTIMQTD